MIYTFNEQLVMIIYFIILGIFISIMFDTINIIFNKIKIVNYILQFISWMIITFICIKYIDKISNGYIPIHIPLFFLLSYFFYRKFLSDYYTKTLLKLIKYKKIITLAILPITLYNYTIRIIRKYITKKGKNDEKINDNINDSSDDDNISRMWRRIKN